ncbi:hypothetical protein [Nocardioides jejuensis]|uniref:Integrase n=1 Tax=Nocardioides jejuensis TaxID=2502782 RepID=A0A4R1BUN9_9ACTN|nr:hypothetical protein [Nocardioides jejuensis]TCJ21643.1 hypothetical protein EPD65_14540 [Nocardioides jejuensis]
MFFENLSEHHIEGWGDITVRFLRDVEESFGRTTYSPGYVWNLLREAAPGTVSPEIRVFVASPPAVPSRDTTPTEAMPPRMLRNVLRQAMRDVSSAEARIRSSGWDGSTTPPAEALLRRHETTAFYILLCWEWSMSADVVADLSLDPAQPTAVVDWRDGESTVRVRWLKFRGGRTGVELMLADKPWRAGSLLRRLRDASAATRSCAEGDAIHNPWLYVPFRIGAGSRDPVPFPSSISPLSIHNPGGGRGLRAWCATVRGDGRTVDVDPFYDGGPDLSYRALRPSAKWARWAATGGGLLLSELVDDNTIETLSAHYLNNEIAMRDIGEAWAQVPSLAEEVARGLRPTAVDRAGTVLSGAPISSSDTAAALGVNHVGTSGCRNPENSPLSGEGAGRLCGQANRSCFACPNGVVSPDDVPALRAYLDLATKAHASLPPPTWELHWGLTVRWVRHVLPLLAPDWEDVAPSGTEMFDLGMEGGPA